ncbi:PREDICTED: heat stress transcription factor A-4a-like [Camelina sativa]|uniref:Heat stress transcription factor A-4a-like n=1 Tax=Camelina sativa TaxID=90675 RepID=A0ABM0V1L3_CAMSA|nr:PREDICTED: heat stress transcription factor A-4a-like [Camelina sativa]
MDGENNNHHVLQLPRREEISDFLNKAYSMVNDPSTDLIISWAPSGNSFIVWNRQECCQNLLPRLLQINDFGRFLEYGFRHFDLGQKLQFACIDFVRGQPQLLDKIVERYLKRLIHIHAVDHFRNHTIPYLRNLAYSRETYNTEDFQTSLKLLEDIENLLSNWRMSTEPDGSNIISLLNNFHLPSL